MKKNSIKIIRFIIISIIVGIIIGSLVVVEHVMYYHNDIQINYIVADDYSYVVNAYDKKQKFIPIKELPVSIDEKFDGTLWRGRLENDKSKTSTFYLYEYNGLDYLKVEISENKFISFGDDNSGDVYYYVEDTENR